MKLFIVKGQSKKLLGGVNFDLNAKVELTPEESELIKKYKADKEILLQKDIQIPFTKKVIVLAINIGGLVIGQNFKCKDIADIVEYEKNVKEACETFKTYLEIMASFGGEEIIEYD